MNIDLNLYKVFFIVANCKSISHAAEKLFISQPAVSKSIKSLEALLQVHLFTRSSKGVSLTKEGEILYSHIEKVFKEISIGEDMIDQLKRKTMGKISLGVSSVLGKNYLIPKLEKFINLYPNYKIQIINTHSDNEIDLILKDTLELAIVCDPIPNDDIEFIRLEKTNDIFVATNKYIKRKNICTKEDLFSKGSFMLLEKGNITRKHIDNYFYNLGFNVVPDIEASNMDFLIECSKINLGITSVLKSFVKKDLENGLLIELSIAPKIPSRYIGIAYKKNATLSIASNSLIEFLQSSIIE